MSFIHVSGECVISLVLSRHNKNLKRRMLKPSRQTMSKLLDRSVLQLRVTAQFYLENKGKYILEAWGQADPKGMKRSLQLNFGSSFCFFHLPLSLPYVNWASQEGYLFHLRSSLQSLDLPLFHFCGFLPSLSFSHCHFGLLFFLF